MGYVDNVNGMQYDGTLFKRSTDRKAPHNSYISGENIHTAAEKTNVFDGNNKMPSLSFHESIESAKIGDAVATSGVRNGSHPNFTSTYTYDEDQGTYNRTVNDILTIDKQMMNKLNYRIYLCLKRNIRQLMMLADRQSILSRR